MPSAQKHGRSRHARRLGALLVTAAVLAAPSRLRSQVGESDDDAPAPSARDINQLEKEFLAEKDEKKRASLISKMTWLPGAAEVLRRIATTDPSDDVAFAAGNAWRRILLIGVVGVLQGRLDAKTTTSGMIHAVVSKARPGSIIIFHINGRGWKTAEALPTILRRLRERGFRFVRLSGLMASRENEPKTTEPGATLRLRELLRRGAEVLHRFVVSD